MDRGEKLPGEGSPETKPEAEEDPILDPAAEKHIKAMRAELDEMKRENVVLKQSHQQEFTKKVQTELTNTFNEVTKENPFEQVVHEDGRNITQEVFSSMAAFKANVDFLKQKQDPKFKMKTIQEYFADTARDLAYLEKYHRSNGNIAEMTPELVKKSNPKVAEALGKEAIEAWLKANEDGSSPVVRPSKTEPSVTAGTRNIKSLDDGLAQALADPDIAAELEKMGKQKSVFYHGGK